MQDDNVIIEEILGGSHGAMEVLVNKYYKMIFVYIYRNIGQYHTSYDLTQEVFIKMMKAIDKFDMKVGSFQNWIFKIAVNTVKDYFKGSGYRAFKEVIEVDKEKCDENNNIVDLVSRMSDSEEIKNAIMQLNEDKREVIILRFYHDMKIKDIAKVTETKESTIKSRLKQGITELRSILREGLLSEGSLKGGKKNDEEGFGV